MFTFIFVIYLVYISFCVSCSATPYLRRVLIEKNDLPDRGLLPKKSQINVCESLFATFGLLAPLQYTWLEKEVCFLPLSKSKYHSSFSLFMKH